MDDTREHTRSYYAATVNRHTRYPELKGEARCDVAVVGAGFTGISAALHLAERGYGVAVVEANRVGWGASGRNGGQLIDVFARVGHWKLPGSKWFANPALALGMLYYRLREVL